MIALASIALAILIAAIAVSIPAHIAACIARRVLAFILEE